MSIRQNVHSGKCPFWKIAFWGNVHSAKCTCWRVYVEENVHLGKCPFGQVFFGEMSILEGVFRGDVQDQKKINQKMQLLKHFWTRPVCKGGLKELDSFILSIGFQIGAI